MATTLPRSNAVGAAPDLAEVFRQLDGLRARVAALEQRPRLRDVDDARVLLAVANRALGTRFTSAEVVAHATAWPDLREALESADCDSPRALGRLFRRIEGKTIDNVQLDRVGQDRDGILWTLRVSRVCVTTSGGGR